MTEHIQARADRYSAVVAREVRNTMRAAGLAEHDEAMGAPLTVSQIGQLSARSGVAPADWFPLRDLA